MYIWYKFVENCASSSKFGSLVAVSKKPTSACRKIKLLGPGMGATVKVFMSKIRMIRMRTQGVGVECTFGASSSYFSRYGWAEKRMFGWTASRCWKNKLLGSGRGGTVGVHISKIRTNPVRTQGVGGECTFDANSSYFWRYGRVKKRMLDWAASGCWKIKLLGQGKGGTVEVHISKIRMIPVRTRGVGGGSTSDASSS